MNLHEVTLPFKKIINLFPQGMPFPKENYKSRRRPTVESGFRGLDNRDVHSDPEKFRVHEIMPYLDGFEYTQI